MRAGILSRVATLLVMLASLLGWPGRADACSCVGQGPPCERFWEAQAVFVGRVVEIEPYPSGDIPYIGNRRVRLDVLEPFRGVTTSDVEVITGSGGGDCGYPFRRGGTYLVYASAANNSSRLATGICTRTRALGDANEDLAYGRGLRSAPSAGGVIAGTVRHRDRRAETKGRAGDFAPVPGVDVAFECGGLTYRATTNESGRFEIAGLSTGTCTPRLKRVAGHYWLPHQAEVRVRDLRGCASVDFTLAYDGHVRGRIVDHHRDPLQGLTVDLIKAEESRTSYPGQGFEAITEVDGVYEIVKVPPGEYVVGVNVRTDFKGGPYGQPVFFPGLTSRTGASTVHLEPSQLVELGELMLPTEVRFVQIRGSVVTPDGRPVEGARVYVFGASTQTRIFSAPLLTDAAGAFTVAAPDGAATTIVAELRVSQPNEPFNLRKGELPTMIARDGLPPQRIIIR